MNDTHELDTPLSGADLIVLYLLAKGQSVREIGLRTAADPATVELRIKNIMNAFEATTVEQAVAKAVKHGLIGSGGPGLRIVQDR